ncbi:FAD-dependent monooxygenase [Thalassotalea maritima]|uniref:FAD-dependent monooxygenase n=1 Tax=Thalassotalea maritima TaxID=3242416 RepID=UPI003527B561
MQHFDVIIVGGGMVGLSAALAIRVETQLNVAVIEPKPLNAIEESPQLRVSAINDSSQNLLRNIGVWQQISEQRHCSYTHMHVWDKDGFGHLDFDSQHLPKMAKQKNDIGHIIENDIIRNSLHHKAEQTEGITIISDTITNLAMGESEVFVSLAGGQALLAKLLIGADGANSWVRKQIDMPVTFRDYDHHALVATVKVNDHQRTAWQVFLDTGPLALLPLYQSNLCSIVWSLPPELAAEYQQLDDDEFNKRITTATDGKFANVQLQSKRVTFPLTMRLARDFVKQRVILIGDAAHTIHPLAGQGVNLGLVDVAALVQTLQQIISDGKALDDSQAWNAFSRWRKSDASEMMVAMEAIKQGFALQQKLPKFIRGMGMSLVNNIAPAKQLMIAKAIGQRSDLPALCKYQQQL